MLTVFLNRNHLKSKLQIDAVKYYEDHKELGLIACARNLGTTQQSLSRWKRELRETGDIECRGSGNYSSDEAKENARLRKELQDTKDALEILKKAISILGE